MRGRRCSTAVFVVMMASLACARAEEGRFDLQHRRPACAPRDLVHVRLPEPIGHLSVAGGGYLGAGLNPLYLSYRNQGSKATEDLLLFRLELDVFACVGVADWLELSATLPIALWQLSANLESIGTEGRAASTVLGDLRLGGKLAIPGLRHRPGVSGFGAALTFGLTLPTGDQMNFAGDGAVGFELGAAVDYRFPSGGRIVANLGVDVRPEREIGTLGVGPTIDAGIAGVLAVSRRHDVNLFVEWLPSLALRGGKIDVASSEPCPFDLGLQYLAASGLAIEVMLGGNFCGCVLQPSGGVRLAYAFERKHPEPSREETPRPPPRDRDHDGVPDEGDGCPDERGPEENHGCPDTDEDGDGIVDRLDQCPHEAAPGTTHGCPAHRLEERAVAKTPTEKKTEKRRTAAKKVAAKKAAAKKAEKKPLASPPAPAAIPAPRPIEEIEREARALIDRYRKSPSMRIDVAAFAAALSALIESDVALADEAMFLLNTREGREVAEVVTRGWSDKHLGDVAASGVGRFLLSDMLFDLVKEGTFSIDRRRMASSRRRGRFKRSASGKRSSRTSPSSECRSTRMSRPSSTPRSRETAASSSRRRRRAAMRRGKRRPTARVRCGWKRRAASPRTLSSGSTT